MFKSNIKSQRGNFMVGMSIALLASSILTLGLVQSNMGAANVAKGTLIGNQLSTINTGLASYINANSAAIIAGTAVTGVASPRSPTIPELQALGFINSGVMTTPTYGDSYNILASVTPTGCTSGCQVIGKVWLSDPIYTADHKPADIKLLRAAAASSSTNSIGFSLPNTPATINGSGWTATNPDGLGRAGILLAQSGLNQLDSTYYWKDPVPTIAALPARGNKAGDTRIVLSMMEAFNWSQGAWYPMSVNQNTLTTNIGGGNEGSTGAYNVFQGTYAGFNNTTGWANVFNGIYSGMSNTTGTYNVFNGHQTGTANTDGGSNVFQGTYAGVRNTTGSNNVFSGFMAGTSNTTGGNNVAVGAGAGPNSSALSNTVSLGYWAKATTSNTIQLGDANITDVLTSGKITTSSSVVANGVTLTSDRRLKTNIRHSSHGLTFINRLNPVQYNFKTSPTIPQTGFIAQEVEAVDPTFSAVKKPATDKDFYGLSYTDFIPPMVNAIQEIDAKLEQLPAQKESHNGARIELLEFVCILLGALLLLSIGFSVYIFRRLISLQKKVDAHCVVATQGAACL